MKKEKKKRNLFAGHLQGVGVHAASTAALDARYHVRHGTYWHALFIHTRIHI